MLNFSITTYMSTSVIIYCAADSKRLRYVLKWLFEEQLRCDYIVTQNAHTAHISYGKIIPNAICIPDAGLLWQQNIQQHDVSIGEWQNIPTLYAAQELYTLPFDIFSALFFLLSRYEEYYPYTPDKHGRYPATESVLYKYNLLERPIADEWVAAIRKFLQEKTGLSLETPSFSFLPTYDIDIAYSYKHKGWKRTLGGIGRDMLRGRFLKVSQRLEVVMRDELDPYDSFQLLKELHSKHHYAPLYFILASLDTTPFDKNIHPLNPAMQNLIKGFAAEGTVGIHPSYYTNDNKYAWTAEKGTLEGIIGKPINISRQHFVRMFLPATYRQLLANGITTDFSMGYGTHLGFRCGSAQPFYWYDLENEQETALKVYPFCFMDSTAHYENGLSADVAFARLEKMAQHLIATNSRLITVFHNFSLGTDAEWKNWAPHYARFLEKMARLTS